VLLDIFRVDSPTVEKKRVSNPNHLDNEAENDGIFRFDIVQAVPDKMARQLTTMEIT